MGQEDGRFAAIAAAPFEATYRDLGRVVGPAAWHDLVLAGLTSPHTFGPGPEPTDELDALANGPAPSSGPDVALAGWDEAVMVLAAALHRCDGRVFRPDSPLADYLARDRDLGPAFAATPEPAAAAIAWAGLRRALIGPPEAAPWWLTTTLGSGWQVGLTSPAELAALSRELARTQAIQAVAAHAGAPYADDLRALAAYLADAAGEERWLLGTVAGT